MKESEYYTPSIEEFYVGFEYEHLNKECDSWLPCFYETMLDQRGNSKLDELNMSLEKVKYLDKEDIESLGFTVAKNDPYWYDYKNSRFYLYKDNPISKYWTISDEESQFGFTGSIKNISELKVLLKQLNIHD